MGHARANPLSAGAHANRFVHRDGPEPSAEQIARDKHEIIAQMLCFRDNFQFFRAFRPLRVARAAFANSCRSSFTQGHHVRRRDHVSLRLRRRPARARSRARERDPRAGDGRRRGGEIGTSRACRWAWPRSPWRCGRGISRTTRRTPHWPDRDRFVLSNGHGSMLQYALLHLSGYDLPIDELRRFRQLHSKTPGHPEVGSDARRRDDDRAARPGTRQRRRHGARRAAARRRVQSPRPRDRRSPHVRVRRRRLPDGRHLARGVLARRHARPRQALAIYDDNGISIDGETKGWFTDDTPAALRGLRLARDRRTSTATTSRRSTRRCGRARAGRRIGRR